MCENTTNLCLFCTVQTANQPWDWNGMACYGMREDERNREMTFIVKALGEDVRVSSSLSRNASSLAPCGPPPFQWNGETVTLRIYPESLSGADRVVWGGSASVAINNLISTGLFLVRAATTEWSRVDSHRHLRLRVTLVTLTITRDTGRSWQKWSRFSKDEW